MDGADQPRERNGYFVPIYDDDFRCKVREDYEAPDLLLRQIVEKYKVAASTIHRWARAGNWTMHQPHRVDPNDLLARMMAMVDAQLADLEAAMSNGVTEVAMLSKLVTTLDRVIALKEHTKPERQPSKRVQDLRAKIAERLVELNRA